MSEPGKGIHKYFPLRGRAPPAWSTLAAIAVRAETFLSDQEAEASSYLGCGSLYGDNRSCVGVCLLFLEFRAGIQSEVGREIHVKISCRYKWNRLDARGKIEI